jgi:hypothetical protein
MVFTPSYFYSQKDLHVAALRNLFERAGAERRLLSADRLFASFHFLAFGQHYAETLETGCIASAKFHAALAASLL